jgi:O-antigen/teichoic acid export membrane protein
MTRKPLNQRLMDLSRVPFVRNVAKFQISSVVMTITGFATSIAFTRMLGLEQFGVYGVAAGFAGILSIFGSLGQEATLVTFLSEAVGRKSQEDIKAVLRYFLQCSLLATAVYLILILIAPSLAVFVGSDKIVGQYAQLLLFSAALNAPVVLAFLLLQIRGKIGLVSVLENARAVSQLVLAVILLVLGYNIWGILFATVLIALLYVPLSLLIYAIYRKDMPSLSSVAVTLFHRGTGTYFKQGIWIAASRNIGQKLYPDLFYVVLGSTASYQTVGLFRLALRLAKLPGDLIMPGITRLSAVTIPKIVGGDRKALKSSCIKILKGSFAMSVVAVAGAAICVPPLVPVVYGSEFSGAIGAFLFMLPINLLFAFDTVAMPIARLYKKMLAVIVVTLTGVLIGIGLYYLLAPLITPLYAISSSIVYYYIHALLLYAYLYWVLLLRNKKGGAVQSV